MVLEKWETPMNDDNLRTILLMYLIFASGGSQVCLGKLNSKKTSLLVSKSLLVDIDAALHRQNNNQMGQKDAS